MKRILTLLSCAMMAIVSCGKDDNAEGEGKKGGEKDALSLSQTTLTFESGASSAEVIATSSKYVSAISDSPAWLSTTKTPYSEGKTTITVTVTQNTAQTARTGQITVVCGELKAQISVNQAAAAAPTPSPEPSDFLEEGTLPSNDAVALAKKLGMGWNLGNHLEANNNGVVNETCWGNVLATQVTFDKIKSYGFSSVRIPVSWMDAIGEAPDYILRQDRLDRVAEVVGYAHNAGLNVILNMHHDDQKWLDVKVAANDATQDAAITAKFKAVWKQVAEKFSSEGDYLILEPFNEINDGDWGYGDNTKDGGKQYAKMNAWTQGFVDVVRAAGGENENRYLAIPGYCANPQFTMDHSVLPTDKVKGRLIVSMHCYDPYDYCLQDKFSEWGHTGATGKVVAGQGEKEFVALYKKIKEKYIDQNIPVVMDETGCVNRSTARATAFQRYYLEFTYRVAKVYGIAPFLWENGVKGTGAEASGFFDHGTGEHINDSKSAIDGMRKAISTDASSAYSLKTIYAGAPR